MRLKIIHIIASIDLKAGHLGALRGPFDDLCSKEALAVHKSIQKV